MGNCMSWCEPLANLSAEKAFRRTFSFHNHGVRSNSIIHKYEPGKNHKKCFYLSNRENITVLHRKTPNIDLHFEFGKELGRGQFGLIRLCTNRHTGEQLACKSIHKSKLVSAADVADVRREIRVMQRLADHPNVVQLKGVYEDEGWVHLVMELCEGGELFECISKKTFSEEQAAQICKTLMEVLQYCHARGVIHRDLKPENILLARKDSLLPIKVADFGLAITKRRGERFSGLAGSAYYIAPEVLKGAYSEEIDIWSAGVVLYILLSGIPPFWDDTEEGIFEAIQTGHLDLSSSPWPSMSSAVKDLIRGMLCPDVKRRLTPEQVLNHRWILRHCSQSSSQLPHGMRSDGSYPWTACPSMRTSPSGSSLSSESEASENAQISIPQSLTEDQVSLGMPPLDSTLLLQVGEQNCAHDRQKWTDECTRDEASGAQLSKRGVDIADSRNSHCRKVERWASLTGVVEPTLNELLRNVISDIEYLSMPSPTAPSSLRIQDNSICLLLESSSQKDAYLLDTSDQKFFVMHDKERRKVGWKLIHPADDFKLSSFMSSSLHLCKEVAVC